MKELISVKEPPLTLLRSLLAELEHRDTVAALRLKARIEREIRNRLDGRSSSERGNNGRAGRQSSQDKLDYEALMNNFLGLQSQLRDCTEREARLVAEIAQLRTRFSPNDPLFGRVYMTSNAPLWLILDVQRAFRVRYHPDRHDGSGKRKAEEVFQEAEQVFAKILLLKS
jgi:hypothetical protein